MKAQPILSKAELRERAISFFALHSEEIEQIKALLVLRLTQICLAYTLQNNLPQEALMVTARIKTLDSLLKKLERKGWPPFYYPAEVINDLIGARITSWFLDDCNGILTALNQSAHFEIVEKSAEDYINHPKLSGYRGLHVLTNVSYDSAQRIETGEVAIVPKKMICEIQIRTKLQDAWGDITHDLYYRVKNLQVDNTKYPTFLSDISARLLQEDLALLKFREVYQGLPAGNETSLKQIGFMDEYDSTSRIRK